MSRRCLNCWWGWRGFLRYGRPARYLNAQKLRKTSPDFALLLLLSFLQRLQARIAQLELALSDEVRVRQEGVLVRLSHGAIGGNSFRNKKHADITRQYV